MVAQGLFHEIGWNAHHVVPCDQGIAASKDIPGLLVEKPGPGILHNIQGGKIDLFDLIFGQHIEIGRCQH